MGGEEPQRRWRWPEASQWSSILSSTAAVVLVIGAVVGVIVLAHRDGGSRSPGATRTASISPLPAGASQVPVVPPSGSPAVSPQSSPTGSLTATPSGQTCVPQTAPVRLSVLTFNIKSAHVADGSVRLDLVAKTLAAWHPDVVLLQEVDRQMQRSGRVEQAAYLGQQLHYYWTFAANMRLGGGEYGTAVLSRYPILSSDNTPLPHRARQEHRGLLHTTIDVKGVSVNVYDTHLQHDSASTRLAQIGRIGALLRRTQGPTIMGGDFNAHPASRVMQVARGLLADTWLAVGAGAGNTVPNVATPRGRIDYLLYGGMTPVSAQVLRPPVSDHQAVLATYEITDERTVCVPAFG